MVESFEMHTKVSLDPALNKEIIADSLLEKSEYESCRDKVTTFTVKGSAVITSTIGYNRLIEVIRPECFANGDVKIVKRSRFGWVPAEKMICKRYGLTTLKTIGTRTHITGIIISALVEDKDQQKRKFLNLVRTLKQKCPTTKIQWEDCKQTIACSMRNVE